jgi:ABC-type transport system involved in cytochrome c biogenesis permease subunit
MMATHTITHEPPASDPTPSRSGGSLGAVLLRVLAPLASLRLTVVLMALSIFIVLVATLDQVGKDFLQIKHEYFLSLFSWVNFQVFFPPAFFPSQPQIPGGFWFPGGKLIGSLMALNLLAAHGIRFKLQARGLRLVAGLAAVAVGCVVTWLVIESGSNKDGILASPWIDYATIWKLFVAGLVGTWLLSVMRLVTLRTKRGLEFWLVLIASVVLGCLSAYFTYWGNAAQLNDSGMRILWQLVKGEAAALVLLAGCVLAFKKRAGVVLLHGGIGLVMLSEVLVSTWAVESQMHLAEGEATNYVQDIRSVELAVIDPSAADHDQVWAIPESLLLSGHTLSGDQLPFRVDMVRFYKNANVEAKPPGEQSPATAGLGLHAIVKELPASTGTDNDARADTAAAYVKLTSKDGSHDLGTYLVSVMQGRPDTIDVGGKAYEMEMRFRRHYKPYSFQLIDVTKDDYLGTDTPRNYSSTLRLIDSSRGIDQEVHTWMNNPLRFADETFYQSSYQRDPESGREFTTLSVVSNRGWMIPYVACMIVATGMLAHFGVTLLRFLRRKSSGEMLTRAGMYSISTIPGMAALFLFVPMGLVPVMVLLGLKKRAEIVKSKPPVATTESFAARLLPVLIVLGCMGGLFYMARVPHPAGQMDLYEFGKLPLVYEGRVKPFDTLAINTLQIITGGRQEFKDEEGNKQPAIRWLLDVIAGRDGNYQVFRIDHPEVLDVLRLPRRENHLYTSSELRERSKELYAQLELLKDLKPKQMNEFQRKLRHLDTQIHAYTAVLAAFDDPPIPDAETLRNDPQAGEQAFDALMRAAFPTGMLAQMPRAVPEPDADGGWLPYVSATARALIARARDQKLNPATLAMHHILAAYTNRNAKEFNEDVAAYQAELDAHPPRDYAAHQTFDLMLFNVTLPGKPQLEAFFNHWAPFYWCLFLYLFAFVLTMAGFLGWSKPLERTALWLIICTFAVHTLALLIRIDLSGRPPVTNLYSSAVFIGWACVALGIVLELIHRLGIGNVIASVIGAATLFVAHRLATDGDTLVVLQAVLDTQFWLGTHVVCITLGYATTLLAGGLGCAYILAGLTAPASVASYGKDLIRMIYGVLCFAIFFSFVGTVLGGLWADDSWGRFWGWDPKENGALIIVLWNALVLHARWGGMVKDRGLAALVVAGNIAVCWSWFGVNELGVGLHSYGFTEGVLLKLALFVGSQLVIIGLSGFLPKRFATTAAPVAPA